MKLKEFRRRGYKIPAGKNWQQHKKDLEAPVILNLNQDVYATYEPINWQTVVARYAPRTATETYILYRYINGHFEEETT